MRIIAGKFKGRTIRTPKGLPVRPTTDRTRESLFNILQHEYDWEDLNVLDLFCGTGSVSLEFASRGVAAVTSVDRHAACIQAVRDMAATLGISNLQTVKMEVQRFLDQCAAQYDLIFLDPPYDMPGIETLVDTVFARKLLAHGGTLVLEHRSQLRFDTLDFFQSSRSYGSSTLSFFTYEPLL